MAPNMSHTLSISEGSVADTSPYAARPVAWKQSYLLGLYAFSHFAEIVVGRAFAPSVVRELLPWHYPQESGHPLTLRVMARLLATKEEN